MLQRLPIKSILRLVEIINAILKFHHFPNAWKTAIIVPIIKPGKNAQDPVSYRPISLLSSLSKVTEAVILTRLQEATESHMIPYKFGFRKNLSTAQQLLRIKDSIREGFESGWETGAVLLDIAKAFDRVWSDGLIYKLITMPIPGSIIMLIATYLQGRLFTVRVGSNLSSERVIRAGVVQGSKVGPILFNIFVNDVPSPRNCQSQLCLFADDTAVMSTGTPQTIMEDLNTYLTQLGKWLIQWKIKVIIIKTDKCQAVYFTRRRSNPNPPMLYRRLIHWSNSTKYLGVTLDKKLTYKEHIDNIRNKYNGVKSHLYPLIGRKAKLSLRYKLLLYKALLMPVISYACPVWGAAAKTHVKKLETLQNSTLRMITDVP
nr:putative RNA-directed DNA polymerase from transposon X-element [Araneus ventricosus]GBN24314.1 putative RNA-directed DNA polymerase from transposon X-element [Araneus ventricosus]